MRGSQDKELLNQAIDFAINDSWEASHKTGEEGREGGREEGGRREGGR